MAPCAAALPQMSHPDGSRLSNVFESAFYNHRQRSRKQPRRCLVIVVVSFLVCKLGDCPFVVRVLAA